MGYDLLAVAFMVAITPFVVIGFILFWAVNARDHEELASAWRAYAKKRHLDFEAPEGEWPNRTAPAMAWTDGNAALRIGAVGREANVRTRLVVRPRSTLLGKLEVALDRSGIGPDLELREHPPGFGQRILSDDVKRALHSLRQRDRVTLSYRRGRVVVEWPGGERSDARLDEARRVGAEIARTIEEEFHRTASLKRPAA